MSFSFFFFFSSRRRHTRCGRDWSSDVCSSDLISEIDDLANGIDVDKRVAAVGDLDPPAVWRPKPTAARVGAQRAEVRAAWPNRERVELGIGRMASYEGDPFPGR